MRVVSIDLEQEIDESFYGGCMPVGVSMIQPPIEIPSHLGQRLKNQKKLQGTRTPPSIRFGEGTGVVTGMMTAPTAPDDDEDLGCAVI